MKTKVCFTENNQNNGGRGGNNPGFLSWMNQGGGNQNNPDGGQWNRPPQQNQDAKGFLKYD